MRPSIPVLSLLVTLAACGPKDLPREEIKGVLFPDEGIFAGYDLGDSWADIKTKHPDFFKLRDDDFKQLRRDVGDNAGSNGYFLGFEIDGAGKVTSMNASINGKDQNRVAVREILDDVIAHYDKSVGNGSCARTSKENNSSRCTWEAPGKNTVVASYHEMPDLNVGKLDISVGPPKKKN